MEPERAAAAAQAQTDIRRAEVAGEDAAVLATQGARDEGALQSAGTRDASVLRTAGQRRINLIWELTQAIVAILITATTMGTVVAMVRMKEIDKALQLLSAAFFLIIGFYFSRTNHTKTGGVTGEGER